MGRESSDFQTNLRKRIVGQEEAISGNCEYLSDVSHWHERPRPAIGNLLLPGPTGSGKTRMVEATAESLVSNSHAVI
jgi:ATP-dependent Clp protease ATP-binding subunit ClpB